MDFKTYTSIFKLFVNKKWTEESIYETPLDNFCELVTHLNDQERNLLFDLTNRYTWITNSRYNEIIVSLLNKPNDDLIKSAENIYCFGIISPKNEGQKVKSGHTVLYNGISLTTFLPKYQHVNFHQIRSFNEFSNINLTDKDLIFLVDDYIGSGKTVSECIKEILTKNHHLKAHIHILSLAVQKDAIKLITSKEIPFYYHHVERKGISDYYEKTQIESKKDLMKRIERKLKLNPKYSLGFQKSESLLTLIRTPNNTFPVFWDDYEIKGEKKKAPFPRY